MQEIEHKFTDGEWDFALDARRAGKEGDIDISKRYIEFHIDKLDYPMEKVYAKVELCREFLNELG